MTNSSSMRKLTTAVIRRLQVHRWPSQDHLPLCLLTISLALVCSSCGVCARPSISSISPHSVTAGGNQFLLTVNG